MSTEDGRLITPTHSQDKQILLFVDVFVEWDFHAGLTPSMELRQYQNRNKGVTYEWTAKNQGGQETPCPDEDGTAPQEDD